MTQKARRLLCGLFSVAQVKERCADEAKERVALKSTGNQSSMISTRPGVRRLGLLCLWSGESFS